MAKKKTEEEKKEHSDGVKKRMENLVQYNKDKRKKKKAEVKVDDIEVLQPQVVDITKLSIPVPVLEALPANTIPSTILAVLNKSELELYVKEVSEWYASHPDWIAKEDVDDINSISMEKVIQYRLLLNKKNRPKLDIEKDYSASVYRVQAFRHNLAARRKDRIDKGRNGSSSQTNIAIIAGNLDEEKMKQLLGQNSNEQTEEDSLFPEIKT